MHEHITTASSTSSALHPLPTRVSRRSSSSPWKRVTVEVNPTPVTLASPRRESWREIRARKQRQGQTAVRAPSAIARATTPKELSPLPPSPPSPAQNQQPSGKRTFSPLDELDPGRVQDDKKENIPLPLKEEEEVVHVVVAEERKNFKTPSKSRIKPGMLPTLELTPTSGPNKVLCTDFEDSPPPSPCPVSTSTKIPHVFAHAQKLLSTTTFLPGDQSNKFTGRDQERATLQLFLQHHFPQLYSETRLSLSSSASFSSTKTTPRPSLYISGPPGIGKTALINHVFEDFHQKVRATGVNHVKVHMENCSSLGDVQVGLWERLMSGFGFDRNNQNDGDDDQKWRKKSSGKRASAGAFEFERAVQNSKGKCVLLLDEIDHLLRMSSRPSSSNLTSAHTIPNRIASQSDSTRAAAQGTNPSTLDLLNTIFAMAHTPRSNLVLIGIANALDLTARSLTIFNRTAPSSSFSGSDPNNSKSGQMKKDVTHGVGPELLPFQPYTANEIMNIIKQRLSHLREHYPLTLNGDGDFNEKEEAVVNHSITLPQVSQERPLPLLHPKALEFCAKKVAASTGDVRTALEIIRKSIAQIEREELTKAKGEVSSRASSCPLTLGRSPSPSPSPLPSPSPSPSPSPPLTSTSGSALLSHFTPTTAKKVSMSDMLSALRSAGLTSPNSLSSRLAGLPFTARNVLVAVVIGLSRQSRLGFLGTPTSHAACTSSSSISPASSWTAHASSSSSSDGSFWVRLNEVYEVYKDIVHREETLSVMGKVSLSKMEFTGTMEILEANAFITLNSTSTSAVSSTLLSLMNNNHHSSRLSPPKMKRSFSASSTSSTHSNSSSSSAKKSTPKSRINGINSSTSDPIIRLSPTFTLSEIHLALISTPASSPSSSTSSTFFGATPSNQSGDGVHKDTPNRVSQGVLEETLRISRNLLRFEERRCEREKLKWEKELRYERREKKLKEREKRKKLETNLTTSSREKVKIGVVEEGQHEELITDDCEDEDDDDDDDEFIEEVPIEGFHGDGLMRAEQTLGAHSNKGRRGGIGSKASKGGSISTDWIGQKRRRNVDGEDSEVEHDDDVDMATDGEKDASEEEQD